ncbi:hypothetical protein ACHAW5_006486 [Stephanodiscus triporus]|uniref:NECAP PHear domain-containing protein n=1 Tax=Stephanodiscus triporus TaxID=2934178 RepID=A0ABD3MCY8_9STRA
MLKRAAARSKAATAAPTTSHSPSGPDGVPPSSSSSSSSSSSAIPPDEVIERVRLRVSNAHVFKLPPKPSSGGWRGAEWRDKVWQGTLKVVERGDETAVLLVDPIDERNIFAVCPIRHRPPSSSSSSSSNCDDHHDRKDNVGDGGASWNNGVDRCVDSSRYFVLRIRNAADGRHMYIGLAFNERNDAFDFNTSLEDSRREKEMERRAEEAAAARRRRDAEGRVGVGDDDIGRDGGSGGRGGGGGADYKMKDGETIRVSIPGMSKGGKDDDIDDGEDRRRHLTSAAARRREVGKGRDPSKKSSGGGGFLKPSSKDTPSRLA